MSKIFLDGSSGNSLNSAGMDAFLYWNEKFPYNVNSYRNFGTEIDSELSITNNLFLEELKINGTHSVLEWNAGATESIYSLIIGGYLKGQFKRILLAEHAHPTALKCVDYVKEIGCEVQIINTDLFGRLSVSDLEEKLFQNDDRLNTLLYLEYSNGYTGAKHDLDLIRTIVKTNSWLIVSMDLTQIFGKKELEDLSFCDFFFASCHKYGGMKGVGFLIGNQDYHPIYSRNNSRDGTINHCGIFASKEALIVSKRENWNELLLSNIKLASFESDFKILLNESPNIALGAFNNLDIYDVSQIYPNVILGFGTACSQGLQEIPLIYRHIQREFGTASVIRLSV